MKYLLGIFWLNVKFDKTTQRYWIKNQAEVSQRERQIGRFLGRPEKHLLVKMKERKIYLLRISELLTIFFER